MPDVDAPQSNARLRILLIEDSADDAELTIEEVRAGGYAPVWDRVDTEAGLREALQRNDWQLVLCDYSLPGLDAPRALAIYKEHGCDLPFIIVSGTIGEDVAARAIRAGAHDFLVKGKLARLVPAIERELREAQMRAERRHMEQRLLLTDRLVTIGTLAAGVAHEINNPLAYVIGNIELAIDALAAARGAPAEASRLDGVLPALEQAREGAERIRLTARDLKVFARNDEREPDPVDVREVVESSINMAWNQIRHRARLVRDYSPVPRIDASENRLGQIFLNLLVNAAQAIPEGNAVANEIRVSIRREAQEVVVQISDTGVGISPEAMRRLFQPFFTTKPAGVGTGLGLSICKRIVTELKGTISAKSESGRGATFRVAFPAGVIERRTASGTLVAVPANTRGRVMVIDDEPALIRLVARVLSAEHDVEGFEDAREALGAVRAGGKPDVILCDLMMPEMSGMELYAELEKAAPELLPRMAFLTGGAFTSNARQFLERIPNRKIEKPFDPGSLRAAVRELMASAAAFSR